MLSQEHMEMYRKFYEAACHNDLLDSKTTVMIQMATAMAVGCYP